MSLLAYKSKNSTCFLKQMDTLPEVRRRVTDMKCHLLEACLMGYGLHQQPHSLLIPHLSPWFFLFLEPRKLNDIVGLLVRLHCPCNPVKTCRKVQLEMQKTDLTYHEVRLHPPSVSNTPVHDGEEAWLWKTEYKFRTGIWSPTNIPLMCL